MGNIILDGSECDNELFMYFVKHYIGAELYDKESGLTSNYAISKFLLNRYDFKYYITVIVKYIFLPIFL